MPTSTANVPHRSAWRRTRWVLVAAGILLPYVAQLGNAQGLQAYAQAGWQGNLFALALGAVLWLPLLGLTWLYRYPQSIWWPAVLAFGFAFWSHVSIDLSADAQVGLAVVVIPLLSLAPLTVGALIGWGMDIRARRNSFP